jgi:hypothetical protein
VTGLTSNTAYTFTVTASTPGGTSPASAASNSVTTPLTIGQAFGGGFYAGQIDDSGTIYNLVVGPFSSAESGSKKWKDPATTTAGADSVIDGPQNTADMVADGDATVYPAAHFCNDLTVGGFTDWYFPAKNELEVCYYNLKPTTAANDTGSGINANAVPARASNYTTGDPAQTSAAAFITITGAEAFPESTYWSSTEKSDIPSDAWRQTFSNGAQGWDGKDSARRVRAVRRVPV